MAKAKLQMPESVFSAFAGRISSLSLFLGMSLREAGENNPGVEESGKRTGNLIIHRLAEEESNLPTEVSTPEVEYFPRGKFFGKAALLKPESKNVDALPLPTIGIVGGMGIEATQEFQMLITQAAKVLGYGGEENFVPTIIDNTRKPDRSAFLLGRSEESPVNAIASGCEGVARSGANLILMPCNTAHAFIDEIQLRSPVPIISLVDLTSWYVKTKYPAVRKVGFLATDGSVCEVSREKESFYFKTFKRNSIEIITPDSEVQESVMNAIYDEYGVKKGITRKTPLSNIPEGFHPNTRFYNGVEHLCNKISSRYKDKTVIIAGCTEVPLGLWEGDVEEKAILIDPMKIASLAAVIICHDRNFRNYMDSTKYGGREQAEVIRLAKEAYTVNRPITTQDLKELADSVAELNHVNNVSNSNISDGYSSDGMSDCRSVENGDASDQFSDRIKAIAKKHNCFMLKGQSTPRHRNEDVLRIYFSNSPPLARKDIKPDMLEFEQSIKVLSCTGSVDGERQLSNVRVHKDYITIPFSEEVKSQLIEMEVGMKTHGMSR